MIDKSQGHVAKMREWGRTQYRNRQAKLRKEGESSHTASCKRMLQSMCPKLGDRVKHIIDQFSSPGYTTPLYLTFVMDMCPFEIAVIALRTFLNNLDNHLAIGKMGHRIGKAFENEARWKYALENLSHNKRDLLEINDRSKQSKITQFYKYEDVRFELWHHKAKTALGLWLLEEIRCCTGLFIVGMRESTSSKMPERFVLPTPEFKDWMHRFDKWKEAGEVFKMALPDRPVDWHGLMGGGYDIEQLPAQKFFTGKPVEWFEGNNYDHVMSAVNKLQRVEWKINEEILDLTLKFWENERVVGNIPQFGEIPEQPYYTGSDEHELMVWKLKQKDIKQTNASNSSKRFQACRILHLAKMYRKWEKIYFPYRCDYRGRVYALPYYLHPQGSDLAKSLLDFKNGQQVVDEEDLEAVLIHGANMWGVKGTRAERLEWVGKRQKFILEAADDPHGTDWWTDASDPFCFLRFCLEFKKFTEEGYGYVSYLPVRQDCSNNGMQILSLLLRDKEIGRMCNLVEEDKANDMYQYVADRIHDELMKDGGVIAKSWMQYGIKRKIAKMAVMNRPYGATSYNLVQDLFKSIGVNHPWSTTGEMLTAVIWISNIINKIADEVCEPVNRVMKYLRETIRCLPYENGITWTTPTGFKVKQSFSKYKKIDLESVFDNTTVYVRTFTETSEIDTKQHGNAVTANFIHSLDACIVHQVANEVDFDVATIHDCFVTHASNVRKCNTIVRQMYAKTFSVDLLTEFRMEQINNHPTAELPLVPELGDLDVSAVKRMKYLLS